MSTVPEELRRLAARRWRLAVLLTSLMIAGYFGFILLVAFDKPLAGTLLAGGRISLGIVLGAATIVLAPVLTAIYVRWANRRYDVELEALRRKHERS
jgi:uncharacterized membrane protein (DUF485 family)